MARLVPPARLRVRVKGPEGMSGVTGLVLFSGDAVAETTEVEPGLLAVEGLPPGRYALSLFAHQDRRNLEGKGFVEPGVESTIMLSESPK